MDMKEIERINELYRKQKAGTLTPEEKEEQARLRKEYIQAIRTNLRGQIENTVVEFPDGTQKTLAETAKTNRQTH